MENTIIVDAQEKRKRELRLQRFGTNDSEYLKKISQDKSMKFIPEDVELKNPKESYKIIPNKEQSYDMKKLMFYGVNLMNTNDVEEYLSVYGYKLKKIFWLNDFTCVVQFDNDAIAKEAFWKLTESEFDSNKSEFDNYNWKNAKTFMVMNRELDIEVRFAQEGDNEKKATRKESVFYRFYNRKEHKSNNNNHNRNYNYYGKNRNYHYGNKRNRGNYKRERSRDKERNDENVIQKGDKDIEHTGNDNKDNKA